VKKRNLALAIGTIITSVVIFLSACKKINESTELGGGLIPPVDNITTFDTTLTVQAFNDTFGLANDSQYLLRTEEQFLGRINNDPFFGKTDARMFFELKPSFYKYYFPRKDSIAIDSIVLVLNYLETYGDTTVPQTVNVYELDNSNNFTSDSVYLVRVNYFTYSHLLGTKTFMPSILNDSIKAFRDTTVDQLRIKLDTSFARRLLTYDSTNAYLTDSAFRSKFKGFALQSMGSGNAVMGFNLGGTNTKLAIYYSFPKVIGGPGRDTVVSYFNFTSLSAGANYVKRDYSGTPFASTIGGGEDNLVYLQNSPGTYSTIRIPALPTLSNRVVHRAELIAEEVYDISDTIFTPPSFLFLDAYDPSISKYRTIPYDLVYSSSGALNFTDFGVVPVTTVDPSGNPIKTWHFNVSRYVQHVLNGTQTPYDLRMFAPFTVTDRYGTPPSTTDLARTFFVNPSIVKGRVRLAGGTPGPQRMRLRIVYSKL
jgi:hypothetical protein